MKKIGLDTSFINFCSRANISGTELSHLFKIRNFIPYICQYVIYELARFFEKDASSCKELFQLLLDLNPNFVAPRDILYNLEYNKLKNGDSVIYETSEHMRRMIHARILSYINNAPNIPDNYFISRQAGLQNLKEIWAHDGKKNLNHQFEHVIKNFDTLMLDKNKDQIDYARKVIRQAIDRPIILSDDEIVAIVANTKEYPVFNALIRSISYLNFLVRKDKVVPSEDRFTDNLILIEYAYCDFIISNDIKLIEKHAKNVNPKIELLKAKDFVESIIMESKGMGL